MGTNNEAEEPNDEAIPWHPAFVEAIRLELGEYADDLEFLAEHQLTREPLRIDVVIIKKKREVTLKKNIASIFRGVNVVEYKSPDDYVSVRDFYKVYGYACIYVSLEKDADVTDTTLTFVESHYPRELVAHLRETRGYAVEEKRPGIYTVIGDILPIQIIDSRKLGEDENLWLRGLDNRLDAGNWRRVTTEISRLGKPRRVGAYLDAVMRANKKKLREAFNMSDALMRMLEEEGLTKKWEAQIEARGEARGKAEGKAEGEARAKAEVLGLFRQGYTVEEVERLLARGADGNPSARAGRLT
ncbi:MAG: hypothetical protein FWB79_05740 [Treponema sp.]|nr:hypothetical protein [Treponema sp.]